MEELWMPKRCTICLHKQLPAIELALSDGRPYRAIAAQYGVGVMSLSRHNSKGHIRHNIHDGVTIAATVPPELKQTLTDEARRRHVSVSFLIRETLQRLYRSPEGPDGHPQG
jgi:hypothetical protein